MGIDKIYSLVTSKGGRGTIVRITGEPTQDPETGDVTPSTTTHNVRWMYQEDTRYSRIVRATATKQDIGSTTFIMWTGEESIAGVTKLTPEDKITKDGITYQVKTSKLEDTGLTITADEIG